MSYFLVSMFDIPMLECGVGLDSRAGKVPHGDDSDRNHRWVLEVGGWRLVYNIEWHSQMLP